MTENIILTTGIYDAIKDLIRRRKVTPEVTELLAKQLRNAKQVVNRELPEKVVTVNRIVTVRDQETQEEREYIFVPSARAKPTKNRFSIFSEVALATIGCSEGDVINWPFKDGERTIKIVNVQPYNV